MKYSDNMFFAQPVLRVDSDDFPTSTFSIETGEASIDDADFRINITLRLKSEGLQQLIEQGCACAGVYLTCEDTRQIRLITLPINIESKVEVKSSALYGRVVLRPVIHTTTAIPNWKSADLHEEYDGQATLPKASLLAVGEPLQFSVDRKRLKPLESIFELASSEETAPGTFQVDPSSQKITIAVHPSTKETIDGMRNNTKGQDILLNAIYLPVVMEVLYQLQSSDGAWSDKSWYRTFMAKCDAESIDPKNCDLIKDAQKLLQKPFLKIQETADKHY